MAFNGDILEITFNNPDVGQGVFFPKAGEGNTYDLGGFRNSDDANGIAGNGEIIVTKNQVRGFFEAVVANDMNGRRDAENMAKLAASTKLTSWTFTVINGSVFGVSGVPVGDIAPDVNAGTFTIKVAGKVKQIA